MGNFREEPLPPVFQAIEDWGLRQRKAMAYPITMYIRLHKFRSDLIAEIRSEFFRAYAESLGIPRDMLNSKVSAQTSAAEEVYKMRMYIHEQNI